MGNSHVWGMSARRRRLSDALEGLFCHVVARRVRHVGRRRRRERVVVVSAVRHQPPHGLQVDRSLSHGRRSVVGRSLASAAREPVAQRRGDRAGGGAGAASASGLGPAQDPPGAAERGARPLGVAGGEHDRADPPASGADRPDGVEQPPRVRAFRASAPQRTVADGLQGTRADARRAALSSADRAGTTTRASPCACARAATSGRARCVRR